MAEVVRYVDTASSGGDGTTQGHSGATAAYESFSVWEAAEQTDLVSDGDTHVVYLAGSTADATFANPNGWTTDATHNLTISGDPTAPDGDGINPTGIASTDYYHLNNIYYPGSQYIAAMDFQIIRTSGNWENVTLVGANTTMDRIIVKDLRGSGTDTRGIDFTPFTGGKAVRSCIIEGNGLAGTTGIKLQNNGGGGSPVVTNCVVTGSAVGVQNDHTSGGMTVTNCAVFNNTDDFNDSGGGGITVDYCASDDGDGTNAVDISPGGTEADDWADAFEDYAAGDYRPKSGSVLIDAGDNGSLPATDILGNSWDTDDIGAFAFPAAAAGNPWNYYQQQA